MDIEFPNWKEIIPLIKSQSSVWPLGLSATSFLDLVKLQMEHPWSKRCATYVTLAHNGKILSSCKLYKLELALGKRIIPTAMLGALFTPPKYRGHGYAGRLIKALRKYIHSQDFEILPLFSLMGTDFYRKLGFKPLPALDTYIDTSAQPDRESISYTTVPATPLHADFAVRHYKRWQARQKTSVLRSRSYFDYKFAREHYIRQNSRLGWPQLQLLKPAKHSGYALFEHSDKVLRVLEIVCAKVDEKVFWRCLFDLAQQKGLNTIRCWQHIWKSYGHIGEQDITIKKRDWGELMIMPVNNARPISHTMGQSFLELDHF